MTTGTVFADVAGIVAQRGHGGVPTAVSDILNVTRRNLIKNIRTPQVVIFSAIQPVLILLLFTYVFGGIASVPGVSYKLFVVPAVLIQTMSFSAMSTGIALTTDLAEGMIDRFRSLPITRSAVLAGRTMADLARSTFSLGLMILVSYGIGFRFKAGALPALGAIGVAMLFAFAFSWISATIGLAVKDPEAAQAAGFIWIFPLIFASTAFTPLDRLPGWMQPWARINPISSTAEALRALSLGGPTTTPLWHAVAWLAGIVVVFSVLSVRVYRRTV